VLGLGGHEALQVDALHLAGHRQLALGGEEREVGVGGIQENRLHAEVLAGDGGLEGLAGALDVGLALAEVEQVPAQLELGDAGGPSLRAVLPPWPMLWPVRALDRVAFRVGR
jgi:hypothetical protein